MIRWAKHEWQCEPGTITVVQVCVRRDIGIKIAENTQNQSQSQSIKENIIQKVSEMDSNNLTVAFNDKKTDETHIETNENEPKTHCNE